MEGRVGLGLATAGVLAGEVVAPLGLVPPSWLLAAALGALLLWLRRRDAPLLAATVVLAGAALGVARSASVVAPTLPAAHVARLRLPLRTVLTGRIVEPPDRRRARTVVIVEAETVVVDGVVRRACGRVRVALRHPGRRWRYGERLRVETALRRPRNFENPGSFDWVGVLARRGIRVTASAWDRSRVARLPGRARGLRAGLERWRARLTAAIAAAVPPPEGPVLQALVVGDDGAVDDDVRDAFTRAGVIHVLSISGLHVGLVAAASFAIGRWLLARSTWFLVRVDVTRLAALVSLGPVVLYTALAGLGVATLRSTLMVAAGVAATLVGRRVDVLRTLALAALGLALVWPGSPLEIAFQLSFVSVAAIVLGTRRLGGGVPTGAGWRARLRAAALVSPCALLGTAPLTAFHFHQLSLVGVVANPVVVPVFGSAVVALGLVGAVLEPIFPGAAGWLFWAAGLVVRPGLAAVRFLAAPAWAAIDVPIPSVGELAVVYALLGALVLPPGTRGARPLVALALALLVADAAWWVHERAGRSTLRVTFLDVGQGDAAVAELPGGAVLVVDAGGFPGAEFDTGAAIVGPFLWSRKIMRVDVLAMTHAHPDHSGGLAYLLAHFRPREFWWTGVPGEGASWEALAGALAATGARVRVLAAGDDPAPLPSTVVLHPPAEPGWRSLNDSSLTLRVGGDGGVLFTGDVEARAESRLLAAPALLRAAVLKVPHHGSRTSSTPGFVDAVAPRLAVMSVGEDNRYHLPAPAVEARYRARGICVARTDRCGAVTVELDGAAPRVRTRRQGCACPGLF